MTFTGLFLRVRTPLAYLHKLLGPGSCQSAEKPPALRADNLQLLHPTVDLARWSGSAPVVPNRVLAGQHRAKPLRVLFRPHGGAARLALSGRMADVCAELDRITQA